MSYRVQEVVNASSRVHVFSDQFTSLLRAVHNMRARAFAFKNSILNAQTETDNKTYVRVSNSYTSRTFTVISGKRGSQPVDFSALIKPKTTPLTIVMPQSEVEARFGE